MSEDLQRIREDISFLQGLVRDDGRVRRASGVGLLVCGVVFALSALRSFALSLGATLPSALTAAMQWDATIVFLVVVILVLRQMSRGPLAMQSSPDAASRALGASWLAVGVGAIVANISLSAAGAKSIASLVLFAFWGGGWLVAYALYRRPVLLLVTVGCYLAAIGDGLLVGSVWGSLLRAIALLLFVALPGLVILRQK